MTQIEQILLNRVKLIEDDSWSLLGSPNSLIKELEAIITAQINQARIDENNMYIKELTRHHFPAGRGEPHIPLVQFHERIAELINNQDREK